MLGKFMADLTVWQAINIILNVLIIPALWILMGIKVDIATIMERLSGHHERIGKLEKE